MKLRIKGDSIRLRLTQSEVTAFAATGYVADAVHFGPGRAFGYALVTSDTDDLHADLSGETLAVHVPRAWVAPWAESEKVGFEGVQDVGEGRTLALLVEKDFECLHKRPDEADAFPHPLAETHAADAE